MSLLLKRDILMLLNLFFIQLTVFLFFSILEFLSSKYKWNKPKNFNKFWLVVVIFSIFWFQVLAFLNSFFFYAFIQFSNPVVTVLFAYLFYSFCNYWVHRFKHRHKILWQYFHKLHHSPPHMEAKISFYRHPVEVIFNTFVILFVAKIFGLSIEMICAMLLIEGILECFHHSNIHHNSFKYIDWLIQTPEMHLLHHEYKLHKYNYSPLAFWDLIFLTHKKPNYVVRRLGFSDSKKPLTYLFLKNK